MSDPGQEQDRSVAYGAPKKGRSLAAMRSVLWASLNSAAPMLVGAAVFALASRYLSVSEFGLVALAGAISGAISTLGPQGFGDALVQRKGLSEDDLSSVFWLTIGCGGVLYAILAIAAFPFEIVFKAPGLAPLVLVIGLRILFDLASTVPCALLTRSLSYKAFALRGIVASILAAGVCVVLLMLGKGKWSLALSQLSSSIVLCLTSFMSVSWRPRIAFSWPIIRGLSRQGLASSGQKIISQANLDQIAVGFLLDPHALGIFSFSRRIYQLLAGLISGAIGSVSYSLISNVQDEQETFRKAFLSIVFGASAVIAPVYLGIALVGKEIVPIVFGAHWAPAIPSVQAFCLLGVFAGLTQILNSVVNGYGRNAWILRYQVLVLGLTIAAIAVASSWNVNWVVLAMVGVSLGSLPFLARKAASFANLSLADFFGCVMGPAVAGVLMCVAVVLAGRFETHLAPVARIALEIVLGGSVYVVVLLATSARRISAIAGMVLPNFKRFAV